MKLHTRFLQSLLDNSTTPRIKMKRYKKCACRQQTNEAIWHYLRDNNENYRAFVICDKICY